MTVIVSPEGQVRFVHDDALLMALEDLGIARAKRASTVEPFEWENTVGWLVDLRPVGGPRATFAYRVAALEWERQWIEDNGVPEPKA